MQAADQGLPLDSLQHTQHTGSHIGNLGAKPEGLDVGGNVLDIRVQYMHTSFIIV